MVAGLLMCFVSCVSNFVNFVWAVDVTFQFCSYLVKSCGLFVVVLY